MEKQDPTPIEAIDFTSLNKHTEKTKPAEQISVGKNSKLWLAFLLLITCAIGVFVFLPNFVPKKQVTISPPSNTPIEAEQTPEITEPIIEESTKLSAAELSKLKAETEELLLQVIKKQELLQSKGIEKWAKEEFSQASSYATTGDEYFRKQQYPDAINSYQQAIDALQLLEDNVAPTLAKHLEQGEHALLQANRETALFHFELAQAIDAENTQALNGIKRAETIEELFKLLEQGGNLEAANRLEDAKQIYQQAFDLDPLSIEAKTAIARVSKRLVEIKFTQLIASGYSSLEAKQFNDARKAFLAAQKLMPSSEKAKQGLKKVATAVRREKISTLTVEAQHFENLEEWEHAMQSYQQILSLDSASSFAQNGVEHSQKRAALLRNLDDYLKNPERLYSEDVAKEAGNLLNKVASLQTPGVKILQRATTLKELLASASQPVSIILQSDNQTDVVIFKVGKFGRFESHKVELKPGKYTIVGSRPGYRDVRKVLTITADMTNKNILVRCEEPI